MNTELTDLIQKKNHDVQTFFFAYFTQKILQINPDHILAIMAYGSCLNDTTKSSTSTPDFYVLVDDYKKFYKTQRDRFLNDHLPPNIYHIHTPQGSCKYCVISLDHLEKEVGEKAKDVYHLGRFSKRMGILWAKNMDVETRVAKTQMNAIVSVCKKVLQSTHHNFTLDEMIERGLYLSYQGDVRIESSNKVQKIMTSEKLYYEKVYGLALSMIGLQKDVDGKYIVEKSSFQKKSDQIKFEKFIYMSRVRARLRWPKNMFTVDNWLDYMIAKIERTQGIKIEMTETERKFWYIFGWKHFLRLSRKKLIK